MPSPPAPHWVAPALPGAAGGDGDGGHGASATGGGAALTREFVIDRPVQSGVLKFAVDFAFASVRWNGAPVLDVAPFCPMQTLDVTPFVQRGPNVLSVELSQTNPHTACALSLTLHFADGGAMHIVTDGDWRSSATTVAGDDPRPEGGAQDGVRRETMQPATVLGPVAPELWGLGRRDLSLTPYENYEQWQQAKTDGAGPRPPRFQAPPGFEISELRTAGPEEGSWIAMAFDPQGRLVISREDVGLLRMTLAADRESIERVEPIAAPLEECRGLLFHKGALFANANNSKALCRLQISDAGDVTNLERLREFAGGVGHGRNDLALHGDAIYSIHGDSVELPTTGFDDRTSPLRETRVLPPRPEGTLWRGNGLRTGRWELLHAGLRNPYGVDVSPRGDAFTFDADNEFDMGTPWYRPTRILQLVEGGDSGYREVTGQLPPRLHDQPDHAPPLLDIGRSSPTSVMFGAGLDFPAPYAQALFALDWTYGRVLAVHLAPRGRTFRASAETFLQGRPLNVTDVAAGPDGAMYLITGGRRTQSALYRVAYVGPSSDEGSPRGTRETSQHPAADEPKAPDNPATNPRRERLNSWTAATLGSFDPVARCLALVRHERQSSEGGNASPGAAAAVEGWDYGSAQIAALMELLSRARRRDPEQAVELLAALHEFSPADLNLTSQFLWVRIADLGLAAAKEGGRQHRGALIAQAVAAWRSLDASPLSVCPEGASIELRRRLAYLLGELEAEELPALAGATLLVSGVQEDQLAGLLALRRQTAGWTPELRRRQFAALNAIPRMIGGEGLPKIEAWLREETLRTLSDAERASLADVLAPQPVQEPLPPVRPVVQRWTLDDLSPLLTEEAGGGDAAKGRELFVQALCSRCHRVGLRGAAVGPDLTFVGRRFTRRDILESVITPSRSVAENYRLESIVTSEGQVFVGRIIPEGDYRQEVLRLSTDALDASQVVEIDKKSIAEHQQVAASPMPTGLFDSLTRDEIRDLLAFLEAGG